MPRQRRHSKLAAKALTRLNATGIRCCAGTSACLRTLLLRFGAAARPRCSARPSTADAVRALCHFNGRLELGLDRSPSSLRPGLVLRVTAFHVVRLQRLLGGESLFGCACFHAPAADALEHHHTTQLEQAWRLLPSVALFVGLRRLSLLVQFGAEPRPFVPTQRRPLQHILQPERRKQHQRKPSVHAGEFLVADLSVTIPAPRRQPASELSRNPATHPHAGTYVSNVSSAA